MRIREMAIGDIQAVLPIYISYYNEHEGGGWTEETAGKRIRQVLGIENSFSLILKERNTVLGFAMGYFKQYDDLVGYTLETNYNKSSSRNRITR